MLRRRLMHVHRLEATLEGGITLHILAELACAVHRPSASGAGPIARQDLEIWLGWCPQQERPGMQRYACTSGCVRPVL